MDSEDDMMDANDVDSVDDDFYSGDMEEDCYSDGDGNGGEDYDDDGPDYDFMAEPDDLDDAVLSRTQQSYTVLKEEDIRRCQEDDITRVSTVLSISRFDASILLRHYNWSISKVHDEWFADEEAVRKSVGLLDTPVVQFSNAREDMINLLASDEVKDKYSRYLLRSYIEDNRKTKWCPAPGCEYAVDFGGGGGSFDVSCLCSYSFCWNCTEEAHRPVDCGTVAKWILKNSAESENMNWILANSKPCPKCKRPIEKNQGCMHMTCTPPCKFEFCWLCLGAWSDHGERTGGFYACNRYEAAKQEGAYDEAERRREMAKNSLERYTHYYERWASNQLVVECRRVLKWTYAYGYYLPEHELAKGQFLSTCKSNGISSPHRKLSGCLLVVGSNHLGEAESGLERLHQCAEKELQQFLNAEGPSKEFDEFRTKLAGLTRALENGLADVDSHGACSKTTSSKNTVGVGKGRGGRGKGSTKSGDSIRIMDD
ncbi:hypothetical protein GH714_010634 [Hevea brasiliensis]|uniref:RBR-type E3 ubiquitin transferase n=1 Tax=Hevea brasiliensis TaxID=3981 RepID=A0A6A6LKN0_HEVBR|nr:hypothetical protein GH714_010634 [Hevea brasiliensis]